MKTKNLWDSFTYAIIGFLRALTKERNMKIHLTLAIIICLFAALIGFNRVEMAILLVLVGFVLCAELFNTAIEDLVDIVLPFEDKRAAAIKNTSAGAVLVTATVATLAGYLLFFDRVAELYPDLIQRTIVAPAYALLLGLLIVIGLVILIKHLQIPFKLQGGMPSGHAAISFALATTVLFVSDNSLVIFLSFLLAGLVAQSRVEAKIHTIWEVVLGAIIGIVVVALTLLILTI